MQATKIKLVTINKEKFCRGKTFHHSIKAHGKVLDFCTECKAFTDVVVIDKKKKCTCCRLVYPKSFKKSWKTKILKAGLRQHSSFIKQWCAFPTIDPPYLEILYKGAAFDISVKYLSLYMEQLDISEDDKIQLISKKLGVKGFRVTYPKAEATDIPCNSCGDLLVHDIDNRVFCVYCNGAA